MSPEVKHYKSPFQLPNITGIPIEEGDCYQYVTKLLEKSNEESKGSLLKILRCDNFLNGLDNLKVYISKHLNGREPTRWEPDEYRTDEILDGIFNSFCGNDKLIQTLKDIGSNSPEKNPNVLKIINELNEYDAIFKELIKSLGSGIVERMTLAAGREPCQRTSQEQQEYKDFLISFFKEFINKVREPPNLASQRFLE